MAVDVFLKLDGIKGESTDDKYKNEIDVLSWSWGMTQSGTTHLGPGAGSGKVQVSDLSFSKYCDTATPAIMKHCCDGKHIPSGLLVVRKAGGESQVEYFKVKMEEILITSYQTGGSKDGLDRIVEHLTLNFAKYLATYTSQTVKGTAGAAASQGWNMATNVAHA
jgi:type VI secretion system secreted protein Hcp